MINAEKVRNCRRKAKLFMSTKMHRRQKNPAKSTLWKNLWKVWKTWDFQLKSRGQRGSGAFGGGCILRCITAENVGCGGVMLPVFSIVQNCRFLGKS